MQNNTEIDAHAESVRQSADIGKQLRRARESGNLSIQYVASCLHLSPRVIIALEENNFSQFQPVFVKGYLRNYCRLLNLPVDTIIESYSRTIPPEKDTLPFSQQNSKSTKPSWVMYLLLFAGAFGLLAGVGGKYLLSLNEPVVQPTLGTNALPLPSTPTVTETDKTQMTSDNVTEEKGKIGQLGDTLGVGITSEKPSAPAVPKANEQTGSANPGFAITPDEKLATTDKLTAATTNPSTQSTNQGQDTLKLHLTASTWVGIRDHNGQRLANKKMPTGSDLSFSGQAPFIVVLGNSSAAKIELNGNSIEPPKTKAGTVARFTLDKSGVLVAASPAVNASKSNKPAKKKTP